ncbi:MAG: response regulator transcription factor [Melioribacteraceae bacterium]
MKIAIIDDSSEIRRDLIKFLIDLNGIDEILEANDVHSALTVISRDKPEMIVLDFQLKTGTALDVLKKLDQLPLNPIIIILSNYNQKSYREKCFELGAKYYFDKSADIPEMIDTIESITASG